MSSSIALITQDAAPSAVFELLAKELVARNCSVSLVLGKGAEVDISTKEKEIAQAIDSADAVLLGMSSSPELATAEVRAGEYAAGNGKPVCLWADIWDCVARGWFTRLRYVTDLVFVVDEDEEKVATDLFQRARVVITGNPLWERARYAPISREDARMQQHVVGSQVVLCALTKAPEVNKELLRALTTIVTSVDAVGLVGLHQGDQTDRAVYDKIVGGIDRIHFVKGGAKMMLPAADMLLNGTSATGIEAALQGIPVCEFKGRAIQTEEARIYPSGWKLPQEYPGLVMEASEDNVIMTVTKLLGLEMKWHGIVGDPPMPHAIGLMADELMLKARYRPGS